MQVALARCICKIERDGGLDRQRRGVRERERKRRIKRKCVVERERRERKRGWWCFQGGNQSADWVIGIA